MKWIFFLICLLSTTILYAEQLSFCQESEAEAPALTDFDIANQTYKGAHAAVVAHALSILELDFTIERLPWLRCMYDAHLGKFDGIIGVDWSKERSDMYDFPGETGTIPIEDFSITRADYYVYAKEDSSLSWDGHALSGLKHGIAAPKGYVVETLLKSMNAHKELESGLTSSLELLANKRIDGVVLAHVAANDRLGRYKGVKIVKLTPVFYQQYIYVVFSLKSKVSSEQRNLIWQQIRLSKMVMKM